MTPLQRTKPACRSALLAMGALTLSWLSGCSAPPSAKPTTPPITQPTTQAAASTSPTTPASQSLGTAPGVAPATANGTTPQPASHSAVRSPGFSQARNERDYRQDAAKHLYALHRPNIYQGRLPPMLEAVGVLNVDIDKQGAVKRLHWMRAPRHAPQVMKEIERLVQAAAPYPVPQHLRQVTYTDVWLWHKSGKFQLDTLTEGQD
jgi:periplasmic protein TonB